MAGPRPGAGGPSRDRRGPHGPTPSGAFAAGGFTLEPYLQSLPTDAQDFATLAPRLARWHAATRHLPPRPGVPASAHAQGLPRSLARRCRPLLPQCLQTAIHGDLHPGNLLRQPSGQIALIDWEESRRDATAIDRVALDAGPRPPALALNAIACWHAEPERARSLARRLALWT